MAGLVPAMMANFAARGVLMRRCADGKTPLRAAYLCNRRPACHNAAPAGVYRESPRSLTTSVPAMAGILL